MRRASDLPRKKTHATETLTNEQDAKKNNKKIKKNNTKTPVIWQEHIFPSFHQSVVHVKHVGKFEGNTFRRGSSFI